MLVVVALVLIITRSLLLSHYSSSIGPLTGDEPFYDELARNLLNGDGYTRGQTPSLHRPPGWPATLATIYALFGDARATVVFFQGLFDGATGVLGAWIAFILTGSRLTAALTFLLVLAWPPFLRESRFLQTEPLATALTTLVVLAFAHVARRPGVLRGLLAGVAVSLGALVRPTGLIIAAGLGLGWFAFARFGLFKYRRAILAIVAGALIGILPWTFRNASVSGEFVLLSLGAGEQLMIGSQLETNGYWDHDQWVSTRARMIREAEAAAGTRLSAAEQDKVLGAKGRQVWREHPVESLGLYAKRVWRLVFVRVREDDQPVVRFGFLAILIFFYLAWLRVALRPSGAFALPALHGMMVVAPLTYILVTSVFYTNSRYLEPVRPMILVFVACYLTGVIRAIASKRVLTGSSKTGIEGD